MKERHGEKISEANQNDNSSLPDQPQDFILAPSPPQITLKTFLIVAKSALMEQDAKVEPKLEAFLQEQSSQLQLVLQCLDTFAPKSSSKIPNPVVLSRKY